MKEKIIVNEKISDVDLNVLELLIQSYFQANSFVDIIKLKQTFNLFEFEATRSLEISKKMSAFARKIYDENNKEFQQDVKAFAIFLKKVVEETTNRIIKL
jgi:hypothetical protein